LTSDLDAINFQTIILIETSDAEGDFHVIISIGLAVLVFVVIYWLFRIAYSDPYVRFAIFANDFGIQFITLFFIVIAFILFGIIGVLEGKELSAVLAGLSGYILGRHAATGAQRRLINLEATHTADQGRDRQPPS
jgi:hypothetical protein